jgi:hypothetical protein
MSVRQEATIHERKITDNGQEDRCGAARSSSSAACLRRFAAGRASAVAQTEAQAAVCVCVLGAQEW